MSHPKQNNNIRVMCRFRPMNEIEQSKDIDSTIIYKLLKQNGAMIDHPDKVHHPQPMPFYFDKIFDRKAAQVEVFEEAALPLIDNIFEGYNATIFAYGQTGAGKTHTMMGDMIRSEQHPRHGIIPRVVGEIWNRIVHASTNVEFELKLSFLEIYNEEIYDLLSTSSNSRKHKKKKRRQKLMIREYSDQVFVENLNEIYVRDQNELFDLIKSANKKRVSAETKMNRNSSRSHAVLNIILGQEDVRTGNSKKSKFCLVDLAGSEKVGKTQAKGIRLKEATSINKSLTTLGTCMNKLADNMNAGDGTTMRHVPFRESVLTRLLSDSLGGNCKTALIINASPCGYNVEETISTLRFGERAKRIKTKARINQIKTPQQYRKELQMAQTEIMKLYRIIEDCATDISAAFKGTLNVETCTSYKALLDLKKYTLNIIHGGSGNGQEHKDESHGLLANILPDLSNLQSLKKIHTVKKQQKQLFITKTPQLQQQPSYKAPRTSPRHIMMKEAPKHLTRPRTSSFERLDVDNAVILQRKNKKKDPLKKKTDFKVSNSAAAAFQPPQFDMSLFDVPGEFDECSDGLSLGDMQLRGGGLRMEYNSNMDDSECSDSYYNSEYGDLCVMSPAADVMSDASSTTNANNKIFKYDDEEAMSDTNFTDFQEEELPANFLELSKEERVIFAKKKRIDPLLIEYRYIIAKEIEWKNWNSDDEIDPIMGDREVNQLYRPDMERSIEYNKQRVLMLCRLIRNKTQQYVSRMEISNNKYKSISNQYRAKNEENNKLMQQNTNLEKLFERTENKMIKLKKDRQRLQDEYTEHKRQITKLQKHLHLKESELKIEKENAIGWSESRASLWRKKVHEKYGNKYLKRIENDIIRNQSKDLNIRFHELATAFKSQSDKYQGLEEIIESTKHQISKYEALIRQKDDEEDALREEIENEEIVRKELRLQHNLEIKQIRQSMKKNKNKADMWKRRAFVYKNAVNSLMEEAGSFEDEDDEEEEEDDEDDEDKEEKQKQKHLNINIDTMTHAKLTPLHSLSPRSMQKILDEEDAKQQRKVSKSPRYGLARKARTTIDINNRNRNKNNKTKNKTRRERRRDRRELELEKAREDPFHMTPSQKASLTSVKMKIRGGGGSDEDVYRTPIKSSTNIYKKGSLKQPSNKRQTSQPLNGSLPRPVAIASSYGADDYNYEQDRKNRKGNRSRSPLPIDKYLNDSVPSPSMYHMAKNINVSPRPNLFVKKGSSPLPPPPRHNKDTDDSDDDDDDDGDEEEDNEYHVHRRHIILPNQGEYTSPAGTFFSKIKHINDDDDNANANEAQNDDEDDSKRSMTNIQRRKRKVVSMPEPTGDTDDEDDDDDDEYSDNSSYDAYIYNPNKSISILNRSDSGKLARLSAANIFQQRIRRKAMD